MIKIEKTSQHAAKSRNGSYPEQKRRAQSKWLARCLAMLLTIIMALPVGLFADQSNVFAPDNEEQIDFTDDDSYDLEENSESESEGFEGAESIAPVPPAEQELALNNDVNAGPLGTEESVEPGETPDEIGIMPLAVEVIEPGVVGVSSWSDLQSAMSNTSVFEIRFAGNIQRTGGTATGNDLPAISRSLTIDGQGYSLDCRNDGASNNINRALFPLNAAPSTGAAFTIMNLTIIRPNATAGNQVINPSAAVSSNWTINIHNISAGSPSPVAGLISATQAVAVNFTGEVSWDVETSNTTVIEAPIQNYYGQNTVVHISGGDDPINANTSGRSNVISVYGGAQVYFYGRGTGTTQVINMQAGTSGGSTAYINVSGAGALLDVRGNGSGTGTNGGTISMTARSASSGGGGGINITDGAKMNVISLRGQNAGDSNDGMPALLQQIEGGNFIVDGPGSVLNAESFGASNDLGGTIRFRSVGDQSFIISNGARLNVINHASEGSNTPAAIRFGTGTNNGFYVTGGASVNVINEGNNRAPATSGAVGNKGAIEFDANYFTFYVDGWYSNINLIAWEGAAVAAGNNTYGSIYVGEGAVFLAEGNVNSNSQGIFSAGNNFSFECNNPLYYNFVNVNPILGARVFDARGANNTYVSYNSDIAVWGNGARRDNGSLNGGNSTNSSNDSIYGNPYRQWSIISYSLQGANFSNMGNNPPSNDPTFNSGVDSFGSQGMVPYRRISGNNASPIIQNLLPATNADLYVRATGVVPEGLNFAGRPIWTDEVFGRFGILPAGSTDWQQSTAGQVTSINPDSLYSIETGVAQYDGVVRYTNGSLLVSGDSYRVDSAWRGLVDDPTSSQIHLAHPNELTDQVIVIADILPPVPATITQPNNGKIWSGLTYRIQGVWSTASEQAALEPHNPEPAVKLYAVVNSIDNIICDSSSNPVLGALNENGSWVYEIPASALANLHEGDFVYFIVEDTNGNANPLVQTDCHDTTIAAAPYLIVTETDLILISEDAWIGLNDAISIAGLGTDSSAQHEYLKGLIDAHAEKRSPAVNIGTDVFIVGVEPAWLEQNFADREVFLASYPMGKPYTVTFASVDDPSIFATATVTVLPYMYATPLIGANDFTISVNNATALLEQYTSDRDLALIALAGAQGRLSITDAFGSAALEVVSVQISYPVYPGDFEVTFKLAGMPDTAANKVAVTAHVVTGSVPVLIVSTPIEVWIGDTASKPATAILPGEFDYMLGVTALAASGGSDITSAVSYNTPVNLGRKGMYTVNYSVLNSDSNATSCQRVVVVNDGSYVVVPETSSGPAYILHAQSFIKNRSDADANTIIDDARAIAWVVDAASISGLQSATAEVSANNGYHAGCSTGVYNITIRVAEKISVRSNITATVVNKQVSNDTEDTDTNYRYYIGANSYSITVAQAASYAGMTDAVQLRLINSSAAEAWRLTNNANHLGSTLPLSTISLSGVVVITNNIPASGGTVGDSYSVVFAIREAPDITVTVYYTLYGSPPIISFASESSPGANDGGLPLVIEQQVGTAAHVLNADEIRARMTVWDEQDGDLKSVTGYTINGSATASINTGNVGVYQVEYTVIDSDEMQTTATRAIVITDGRYIIEQSDNLILGARNFVILSADVDGSISQVRNYSRAAAYEIDGTPISVNLLTIDPWPVTDYQSEAEPGDYQFTWVVDGRFASKTIIGTVSDADVIFPGGNNDQYAITARNFTVNLVDAQAMIDADSGLNAQLIIKADVKVYRLVDGAPEAIPYVIDSGGFMAVINSTPGYILSFGAKVGGNTVITTPPTMVSPVYGRVSQGNDPVITALSPLEVWIGPEGLKPAGAILPSQYSDLYEVAAFDIEDGEEPHFALADSAIQVTHLEPTSGVILTEPGLYTMQYAVTDSDHNTATAHRLVVVNDGNFMVGDGRVLYATSFVTRLVDVTGSTNPSRIEEDILSKSKARLYDGTTGIEISIVGNIDQVDTGGYHRSVGTYQISITALDTPTGAVSKTIIGEVVDAEVIGPTDPPPFDPVTYVYGTSLMQTISEAESTAAGGDSAILAALKAGASRTYPAGPITHPAVTIIDLDDYVDRMLDSDHQNDIEVFRFTVSDVNGECSITLTITVGVGGIPVVTALPKPLEVLLPVDRAWVDSNGDISVAKLMQGVTATDAEAVTVTNPEGDVIDQVVITIFDVTDGGSGVLVNSIPADRPGIYEVTYSYTDEDHNTGSDTRAVIVNDGRYIYDSTYILEALSFVIRTSDVRSTGISAQLRAMSNAKAWTTGGQPRLAAVADNGGYRNTPNDYNVIIQVSGHADLQKTIIARVIDDGDALAPKVGDMNGANGEILSIVASNFCMNAHDANALVALASTVDYDAMLAGHAQVMFYDRTSAGFVSDTAAICVLLDDGGFADAANQPLQHGDHFMITFGSLEDPAAQTTIIAFVDNGYPPVIVAPSVRLVWTGEPSDKPADAIYYTDWTGMNGVSAYDSTDGDITSAIKMGLLDSSSSPSVFIEGTPVSLDIEDVFQEISYQVTDSDHNTVTVTVLVMVSRRAAMNSDYILLAMSFIETVDNITANGTGSSVILGLATAKAWRIRTIDLSEQHLLPIPVNYLLEVEDSGGYKAVAGEYPIIIGLADEPGYDCSLSTTITAKVIDQDVIGRGPDNFTDTRYVVAANHVRLTYLESAAYVGMTDTVTELLIERAFAEAWVITDRIETFDACVLSNQIGDDLHPLVAGGSYQVVFAPIGISGVSVTVIFEIDNGERPVINFIQEPLVFTRTDYSYALTEADLKAAMEVLDAEDGDLLNQTTVVVAGGVSLNQQNVGVWKVDYSVTDSHNNTATASRAVVIDDGRYIIDKADNIIIGARDFVVKRTGPGRVDGSEGQARSLSYAEAYSIKGVAYTVNWIARPSGYVDAAEVGTYIITWTVSGHSVTKTINAYVTDADTLDPGGKDSAYAIAASDFRVNLTSARAILITGDAAFIFAANAQVFKLIDSAPEATLIVEDRAGFTDTIGSYQPIIFCIASIPISVLHVGVTGTVSQRTAPVISLVTPIDVWVGDPDDPERPVDSILPVDYSDLFGVTADDAEDGDITASIVVSSDMSTGPVNLTQVGMYRLLYDVEDSDGNHPDVLPTRIVVVNDGRYVVGDGRILVARAFVTKVENVTDNPAIINQEILGKSYTSLYDGATGEPISSTEVSVLSNGGYRKEVGTYNITVAGVDVPSGYLYKNIVAEVVDADLVVNEPEDERSDSYYVFGNHITIRISEAATIIGSGDKNSSLLLTLQAGARKTQAGGTLLSLTPIVVDDDGFDVACGIYNVTIADPGLNALLTLSVTVVDGNSPVVSAVPIPLEIIYDPNNLGYVNRSQMMYGVTASDREDGDITGSIVINPDSFGNEVLPVIELRAASVTKITYSVTDSDGNVAEISRALIVNDGSIVFDECYIIQAYSFVIESSEVSSQASAQILERSEAKAFSTDGTEVSAYVADTAGFSSAQGAYHPLVGIIGYADLVKMVTAKVLSPGTGGGNGETYAISARGFRINLADAYVLQTASDTDYQQTFLSRSGAQSYLRNDYTLAKGGTSLLADDSGFRSIDFAPEGDPDYPTIVAVKFWVDEDHSAYVWVNVVVSNGNHPWLEVPALKVTGLNSEFGIGDYRSEVYYGDSEDSIDNLTLWHDTPVDTSIEGIYQVNYKVTDSEGNETTGIGYVLVGPWAIDRDYAVSAWSFVTTVSVVAGSSDTDELILQFSHAKALKVERDINGCVIGIDSVAAIVRADGDLAAIVGSYPHILIGISDELLPVVEISARVIDRDAISNKPDEDTGAIADTNTGDSLDCSRYVVGANNATISFAQAGQLAGRLDADTKAALIEAAKAVGYVISDTGSIDDFTVDVTLNSIGQEVGVYAVTFAPLGVQGVSVTVLFTVAPGYLPELAVDGPLVLDATEDSVYVSLQQLLDGVSVSDSDSPEISIDDVVISAGIDTALPIDQSLVGVKQVIHSVADPIITVDDEYGNKVPATVSVSRAVVINDGRFVVDDDEGDGGSSSGGVIVGAKNFVVSVKDPLFAGTVSDAIALAFAEAYNFDCEPLVVELASALPLGFAAKQLGVYSFTFRAVGYSETTVSVTGEIVDSDVVDLGQDPYRSKYALIASDYAVDVAVADTMNNDADFVNAASARAIKLLPQLGDVAVLVHDTGGFEALVGTYPIAFGITGYTQTERSAVINGMVTNGSPAALYVRTPIELALGTSWDNSVAMSDVAAIDPGVGDITSSVTWFSTDPTRAVDTSRPGIYQVTYTVTGNNGSLVSAQRCVVVNDGRYHVGSGRILEARSFVIRSADVASDSIERINQLLTGTEAQAYNGETGAELFPAVVSIHSTGGYNSAVGEYQVTVRALDDPTGYIDRQVIAKVVDADVIGEKPALPTDPSGTRVYVYGNNVTLYVSQVEKILNDASLLLVLQAEACVAYPSGELSTQDAVVVSKGGFEAKSGSYTIKVADSNLSCQIELILTVIDDPESEIPEVPAARHKVEFNANGGRLTGPQAIYVQEPATTIPYLPSTPVRNGYTFLYWATSISGGTHFTAEYIVTGNMVVYAQWKVVEAPKPPTPPGPVIVNPPTTVIVVPPVVTPAEPDDLPVVGSVVVTPAPVVISTEPGWALFNLLSVVLSGLLFVYILVLFMVGRKGRRRDSGDTQDTAPSAQTDNDFASSKRYRQASILKILASAVLFAEGLLVLLTTQDFSLPMQMIDRYSLIMALLLVAQACIWAVSVLLRRRSNAQFMQNESVVF